MDLVAWAASHYFCRVPTRWGMALSGPQDMRGVNKDELL